jgi:DNA-directed RNA polymerase III subunit RPC8
MFVLSIIEDLVRVPPAAFALPRHEAIEDQLNKKYSYRILHNVGLCIKLYDIQSISDAVVHACQDGSYQCKVEFRMVVFRPLKGQVLLGLIKECDQQKGIRISLEFFDDIYIPPAYLMENTVYNREESVWVWNYDGQELFMDPGNWIRFRIEQSQFIDVGPFNTDKLETQPVKQAPFTVYVKCFNVGQLRRIRIRCDRLVAINLCIRR